MQTARGRRFNLHRGFVSFYVEQRRTLFNSLTFRDMPDGNRAVRHVHIHFGQDHLDRLRSVHRHRFCSHYRRGRGRRCRLTLAVNPADYGAYGHFVTRLCRHHVQIACCGGFNLHRGLVSFYVEQGCPLLYKIALCHMPCGKRAVGHIHVNLRQDHFYWHWLRPRAGQGGGQQPRSYRSAAQKRVPDRGYRALGRLPPQGAGSARQDSRRRHFLRPWR